MALLDKGLKQRIIGALVLLALAVIFVPMLFNREESGRQVAVEAPPMPETPAAPTIEMQPTPVPEPEPVPEHYEIIEEGASDSTPVIAETPIAPAVEPPPPSAAAPAPTPTPAPAAPAPESAKPAPAEPRLDANSLPVSWSIQLASLSSRENAEALQKKLRSQGYNAYIRTADGLNRVFVGPLVERSEATRLRDQLHNQQNLDGFVVRFQPENG
ncbi:SPOR domain-containing protein [Stutzerimonas nosocomialis]|uniref:SPOR domain-containing protein n=1 Tax=Stutzerimonas nosocomialis TaxID=1056496 RepID=UPI001109367B|nr:SPOR domain-containing protein [Stutzerimonas nosocomialis]TLX58126.1 SPOR domain-containing protein [Stutzerimonas nosocomialis]